MAQLGTMSELRNSAVSLIVKKDSIVEDLANDARVSLQEVQTEEWFINEVMKEIVWIDGSYEHLLHQVY